MKNFLEICQRVRQEAGIPGTGPVSVLNTTGELRKVVDWVREAWIEIQASNAHWNFMWARATPLWPAGYSSRDAADLNLQDVARFAPRMTLITAAMPSQRRPVVLLPWERFEEVHGPRERQPGPLIHLAMDPMRRLESSHVADQDYLLELRYYRRPQILENDADQPYLRREYAEAILYTALRKYAASEEAGNVYGDAETRARFWMNVLERQELPEISDESVSLDQHGD